jgi:peptide/nickel transport system substrate-binding protein
LRPFSTEGSITPSRLLRWAATLPLATALAGCGAPRSDIRRERPVVVAYPHGPDSLVPEHGNEELTLNVLTNVYEPLVAFGPGMNLVPALAESWHSEDERTWVFRLPEALPPLHDGRRLDAALVARSLERTRSAPESKRRGLLAAIAAVEARDPRTVVIRTALPVAAVANRLASVHVWAQPTVKDAPPVGTGPYRVKSWKPHGDTVLEAFDGYRGRPPSVRALEFRVIPDVEARLAQVRSGDAHLVVDPPPAAVAALRSDPKVRVVAERGLRVLYLAMDCARPSNPDVGLGPNPFRDVRVRRAAALALDRAALVSEALGGDAEVVDQLVAPAVFGYDKERPPLSFDQDEARRLLAAAGHSRGFDVTLDYMPEKYVSMPAVVEVLKRQLAAVGIRVRPRPASTPEFFGRLERRATAFYLMGWSASSGDAGVSYDALLHTPGARRGAQNGGGYANPEVDRLLDEAARTLEDAVRRRLLVELARRIAAEVPAIPLYRQTDLYLVARDLVFEPTALRAIYGARMRWASRPQ